jgi:hypothetical protein
MEHSLLALTLKTYTMLFLLLLPSQGLGISNQLVEFSEKEITKQKQHSMILLTTFPTSPGKIIL